MLSWKVCAAAVLLCVGGDAALCKIEGMSVDKDGVVWAASKGKYAGVKPEKVIKGLTAMPAILATNGFATIDGFSIDPNAPNDVYFAKGKDYIALDKDATKVAKPKKAMLAAALTELGNPAKVDGFSISQDGTVYIASGGHYVGVKGDAVTKTKKAFPAAATDAGFTSISSMAIDKEGVVYVTKGDHFMGIKDSAVHTAKSCFPSVLAWAGFTSVDGMSMDPDGVVWVAKNGKGYMGVMPGSTKQAAKDYPADAKTKLGLTGTDAIDAFAIDKDGVVYVAKGGHYISVNNDVVSAKTAFPTVATTALGSETVDAFSFAGDGTTYIAKGGHYVGVKDGKVTKTKTAFPTTLTSNGFASIDGLYVADDGTVWVIKGGFYMGVGGTDGNTIVQAKRPVPSRLTDALCGATTCSAADTTVAGQAPAAEIKKTGTGNTATDAAAGTGGAGGAAAAAKKGTAAGAIKSARLAFVALVFAAVGMSM